MELFEDAPTIRLRSYNNKYLVAGDDQSSIIQDRDGSTKNAHWSVEIVSSDLLCFKSCYGYYLTASNKPFIPGRTGRNLRVVQTLPDKLNSSVQWEPEPVPEEGNGTLKILLKTRYGNLLQSNAGPMPILCRNSVTHDTPRKNDRISKKFLWQVEVVDTPPSDLWREEHQSIINKTISYFRNLWFDPPPPPPKKKKKAKESHQGKETKNNQSPTDCVKSFFANF